MNITEKLYEDFTTQVLPKVAEGFEMTKDYAFDLGERYITYLIIMDGIALFITLTMFLGGLYHLFYSKFIIKDLDINIPVGKIIGGTFAFLGLLFTFLSGGSSNNSNLGKFIQDLTIPEVRIYQELGLNK